MKRQYSLILAVSFMIFYNVASGLYYSDCGSHHGKLIYILVEGCDTDCKLKVGTQPEIIVGFTVSERADEAEVSAHAEKGTTFVNLGGYFACNNVNLQCPLQRGTNYKFKGKLFVDRDTPKIQALVSWILTDQMNRTLICVNFNAKFV